MAYLKKKNVSIHILFAKYEKRALALFFFNKIGKCKKNSYNIREGSEMCDEKDFICAFFKLLVSSLFCG